MAATLWCACIMDIPGLVEGSASTGAGGGGVATTSSGNASSGGAAGDSYRDTVLADGPIGYWRFGESPSSTMALDETASGLVGSYVGEVTLGVPGALAGDSNSAAYFDGVDDQVDFGDVLDFPRLAPFSVEAWILPDAAQPNMYGMICAKQLSASDGFELGIEGSTQTLYLGREATGMAGDAAVATVAFGRFSHIVGTFDGTSLRVYVDAVQVDVEASALVLPDHQASLTAGNSSETTERFAGTIDELAVYDKVLSPTRITAHYLAGTAP